MRHLSIICVIIQLAGCQHHSETNRFELIQPRDSGVGFSNDLEETGDFNFLDYLYYYNGGGVAIGDINNDGLPDLYFTANRKSNELYLNKGNFRFENITAKSGAGGKGDWSTGVTMADVNADGFLDIYVCHLSDYLDIKGTNELFINNGDQTFTESAAEFGLNFKGFSTQALFLDYDLDGDLDMYLLNHAVHTTRSYGSSDLRYENDDKSGDRLFRNDIQTSGKFTDVTKEAGIYSSHIGYGLGVAAGDLNSDGCPDLYISNDFHENDYIYINNCDGTFSEKSKELLPHSSKFSMGSDIADFNNDSWPDIVTLDMLPDEESILKKSAGEESNEVDQIKRSYGYQPQLARNGLQLNQGNGYFSDIATLTGIHATDWSWSPLFFDMDNDGLSDLFITNGIVKRPNDLDYIKFVSDQASRLYADQPQDSVDKILLSLMPTLKIANYTFRNTGDLSFEDTSVKWGLNHPSYSSGASYADLDNDGDLDLVTNNINEPAFIYRNRTELIDSVSYLKIRLLGPPGNVEGIGSKIIISINGNLQYRELYRTRGFLSAVDGLVHFGLNGAMNIDSLKVIWPDQKVSQLYNASANELLHIRYDESTSVYPGENSHKPYLRLVPGLLNPDYRHFENGFIDFNEERLMPHKLSNLGPRMATGDVNADGIADVLIGGARGQKSVLYFGNNSGTFTESRQPAIAMDSLIEDVDAEFFDADGDEDLDIYVVSGGNEKSDLSRKDRLYINNGRGQFIRSEDRLPPMKDSGGCVAAVDFDGDNDIDIFTGGRSVPGKYGSSPTSYLLINQGDGTYKDQTGVLAPGLSEVGMVSDAVWSDINRDGQPDLIVAGEWMPITVFINENGKLINHTERLGLGTTNGWWNVIHETDIDTDGDPDFILGNVGENTRFNSSAGEPLKLYLNDFNGSGYNDPVISHFRGGQETPFATKDELVKQIPRLNKKFNSYDEYSETTSIQEIFTRDQLDAAQMSTLRLQQSICLLNQNGAFRIIELPKEAQMFPVYAIASANIDNDEFPDLVVGGNQSGVSVNYGRYDAGYGLVLSGNGDGSFKSVNSLNSGLRVQGDIRDMHLLQQSGLDPQLWILRNDDQPMIFNFANHTL